MRPVAFGTLVAAATLIAVGAPTAGRAADASKAGFGRLPDGREVVAVTLANRAGLSATLISYGASIQSVTMPDRNGATADVALGYARIEDYLAKPQYFGATVGRYANRIARGRFMLDGKTYRTPVNNGPNSLHGGTTGFDKVLWTVTAMRSGPVASVTMRYVSPDGDQGYPGTLTAEATYSLGEDNALTIEYRATTDRPTIVNITNHSYWNLAGEGSATGAMDHVLTIPASTVLPTDAGQIPTGARAPVAGSAFDFRQPRRIGDRVRNGAEPQILIGRGYDHNWIVADAVTPDLHLTARVVEPASGRAFDLFSNQPGVQVYSGNFLDGTSTGKAGKTYRMGDAIVLEPQLFPDTPNHPEFGSARLDPGQRARYRQKLRRSPASPPIPRRARKRR